MRTEESDEGEVDEEVVGGKIDGMDGNGGSERSGAFSPSSGTPSK